MEADVGDGQRGQPGGDLTDQRDPALVERPPRGHHGGQDDTDEGRGRGGVPAAQEEHHREGGAGEQRGGRVDLVELMGELPPAAEELVGLDGDAGEGSDLAAQQGQADTRDVADEDRLREHRRQIAEPEHRRDDAHRGDGECERGHECDVAVRIAAGEHGDTAGGEDRRARLGPDPEVTAGADEGVHDQRADDGVEPVLGREPGQVGVAHRLRDQHRPDGEPGDEVGAQPRAPVGDEQRETGQETSPAGLGAVADALAAHGSHLVRRWYGAGRYRADGVGARQEESHEQARSVGAHPGAARQA